MQDYPELKNGFEDLTLLEKITNLNAEAVASYLAELILNLDLIQDNVTKEAITQALLPVLQSVKETNVKEVAQNLIKAIVNTGIFEDVITEKRVSAIISLLIYKATWEEVLIANNFKELSIRDDTSIHSLYFSFSITVCLLV